MPEHKNAFIAIGESYSDKRISKPTDFTSKAGLGLDALAVLQYPLGLGGNPDKSPSIGIPFTLFMPYKRKGGLDALYSTMQNEILFTQLPAPEFAVALPTPSSALKTDTTVEYNQFDISGALGGAIAALDSNSRNQINDLAKVDLKDRKSVITGAEGVLDALTRNATANGVANFIKGGLLNIAQSITEEAIGQTVPTIFSTANNPFTEFAFKNVQPRLHTFSYVFMPRSKEESVVIDRIINVFKYSMLPRPSNLAGFFDFPYEFQIVHSMQHTTFALLPSVLKVCEIDYSGGTDSPKFFTSDYPAKITINMQFQEVVLLNRDYVTKDEELLIADTDSPDSKYRFRF